jgi:hypothetical protein
MQQPALSCVIPYNLPQVKVGRCNPQMANFFMRNIDSIKHVTHWKDSANPVVVASVFQEFLSFLWAGSVGESNTKTTNRVLKRL